MTLQPLTQAWLDQARALELRCFDDSWSESLWQLYLPHACSYLLSDDDSLLGFALCQRVLDEAELLRIAVMPECRQQGLGRILLQQTLERLSGQGVTRLLLEVRASNVAAIALYQCCGLQQDAIRKGYYETAIAGVREDAYLFSRRLGSHES
ncbi:ribosomal protein S18-alanine N-acetyltransferase [Nitrincola iocasae]|uniref:[Ribosomal protein bS18]-alanine N-acetyltransferase n=1 Tax=Nitrincola iocasae TaxID=2614693 RepID=A0A5J6LGK7_9GAMM|nr:ribosomal protein S18-alanine N-acetyltransferase [Nitrincola iocasae]QEW07727.1 ribosomal-protein-alanine N-acetyltransferase [Nitrincola iocasae]